VARLIVSEFVSVDGVMEAPGGEKGYAHSGWVFPFMGPDQMQYKLDEVRAAEALLLGRVTYEGFAQAWPGRDDDAGFAAKMNRMPKYVVSRREAVLTGRTPGSSPVMPSTPSRL
jgi:dihydrofolate reductase